MRPFPGAALDCFVGNEPSIAAATSIPSVRMTPSRDVTLVGVRHTERETIDRSFSLERQMENVFVAIVEIARRTDRLEMPARNQLARFVLDRDRFDPMDRVLQDEQIAQPKNQLVRQQWV